jgi:Secretion system C-terminal sorting domain
MKLKKCYCSNKSVLVLALFSLLAISSIRVHAQQFEWENIGMDSLYIFDIAIDDSANIYVGALGGVYKSTYNGVTWNLKMPIGVHKIAIDQNGYIYIAGNPAVYKSTDGGNTYFQIAQSIPTNEFYDIEFIPNWTLFLSSFVGVYYSNNEGVSWFPTSFTGFGAIDIGINTNGIMFFGNSTASWFGIYRSSDFGFTWERLQPWFAVQSLAYLNDGNVLAGCYDINSGQSDIYKSTDNGDTWENTNTFNGSDYTFSDFELDTNNDLYLALGGSEERGVYLSINDGISWSNIGLSNVGQVLCLAIDSSGYVYAGTSNDGIFRSPGRTVPVELISFIGKAENGHVILNWTTATETNNRGFEIERLKDSKIEKLEDLPTGQAGWENIGFVEGNGTTTQPQSYSFTDNDNLTGTYKYKLKQIDFDGSFKYSSVLVVSISNPIDFSLEQNYPNPFNPTTTIKYSIPKEENVTLKVFDVLGREVVTLINEEQKAGEYTVGFDGSKLSSGIYFYKLTSGKYIQIKKMILLK